MFPRHPHDYRLVEPSVEAAGIEPAQDSSGWVYVIRSPDGPFRTRFKIGWTKGDPSVRLKALQTGSPIPLELMGAFRGSQAHEKELHERWKWYRDQGEWFRMPNDLLELLIEKGEMLSEIVQRAKDQRAYFAARAADREAAA